MEARAVKFLGSKNTKSFDYVVSQSQNGLGFKFGLNPAYLPFRLIFAKFFYLRTQSPPLAGPIFLQNWSPIQHKKSHSPSLKHYGDIEDLKLKGQLRINLFFMVPELESVVLTLESKPLISKIGSNILSRVVLRGPVGSRTIPE